MFDFVWKFDSINFTKLKMIEYISDQSFEAVFLCQEIDWAARKHRLSQLEAALSETELKIQIEWIESEKNENQKANLYFI